MWLNAFDTHAEFDFGQILFKLDYEIIRSGIRIKFYSDFIV